MKHLIELFRKRRDRKFLRRLERVLNENKLNCEITVSGDVRTSGEFIGGYIDCTMAPALCEGQSVAGSPSEGPQLETGARSQSSLSLNKVQHGQEDPAPGDERGNETKCNHPLYGMIVRLSQVIQNEKCHQPPRKRDGGYIFSKTIF